MTDICSYLNSKDIADYLRGIDYEFTAPEAAFIVYLSGDATLDEKIAAWLEIAETMPDCSMNERLNMEPIPSFRQFLYDYVDLQKRELERFFETAGCVYSYSYYEDGYEEDGNLFSDAEGCIAYAKKYWSEDCWIDDDIPRKYLLEKRPIDQPDSCRNSALYLNRDMKVLSVYCAGKSEAETALDLQFLGMWFALPTPFKRGDIVVDSRHRKRGLFVLDYLPTWGKAECIDNGMDESDRLVQRSDWILDHFTKTGDTTDMHALGFFISEDGDLYQEDTCCSYLDLEYWESELKNENLWAAVVPAHFKHEIDFVECTNLLRFLRIDQEARKLRGFYDGFYPEEYYPYGVWRKIRREGGGAK